LIGVKKVPTLSVVPPASILYEGLAMQDGAEKYGPYNWRKNKVRASIYLDACMRHIFAWSDGEENASDSGKPHLAHAKACLGILIDAIETGNLVDDRPEKGAAPQVLEKWRKDPEPQPKHNPCLIVGGVVIDQDLDAEVDEIFRRLENAVV
jgi:hypothetical protein